MGNAIEQPLFPQGNEVILDSEPPKPDFSTLIESGFLTPELELSDKATGAMARVRELRPEDYSSSWNRAITSAKDAMYRLQRHGPRNTLARLYNDNYQVVYLSPRATKITDEIYTAWNEPAAPERPSHLKSYLAAVAIGAAAGGGTMIQNGNPFMIVGAGILGGVGGLLANRQRPSIKQGRWLNTGQVASWLSEQVDMFKDISIDNGVTKGSIHFPNVYENNWTARYAAFWQGLPDEWLPDVEASCIQNIVQNSSTEDTDITWELLRRHKAAGKLYDEQFEFLKRAKGRLGMGVETDASFAAIQQEVDAEIAKIDTAYRSAWIDFTTKLEDRKQARREEAMMQELLQLNKEQADRWEAVIHGLHDTESDIEVVALGHIKKILFSSIASLQKTPEHLAVAEEAVRYLEKALSLYDQKASIANVYSGLYRQFGESLGLTSPSDFKTAYPAIDSNIV